MDLEIVVPVYNEERALEGSIRRLHGFLSAGFPFSWQILIADNASTDATLDVAAGLADELQGVEVLHLPDKGRGRALHAAWSASPATVVAYMDIDLSTDLRALLPLVAPLMSGHSDLAIGTRLSPSARVVRGPKREFISRAYNRLLHTVLRTRFSDAQCGFKAIRVANALALALTAVANTHANRHFTFGLRGRRGLLRQHAAGAVVYAVTLALTSAALVLLQRINPHPARAVEVVVLVVASMCATVTR